MIGDARVHGQWNLHLGGLQSVTKGGREQNAPCSTYFRWGASPGWKGIRIPSMPRGCPAGARSVFDDHRWWLIAAAKKNHSLGSEDLFGMNCHLVLLESLGDVGGPTFIVESLQGISESIASGWDPMEPLVALEGNRGSSPILMLTTGNVNWWETVDADPSSTHAGFGVQFIAAIGSIHGPWYHTWSGNVHANGMGRWTGLLLLRTTTFIDGIVKWPIPVSPS